MAAKGTETVWLRLRSKTEPYEWLVHPDLIGKLADDAREKETNLSDVACRILCAHFSVDYTPKPKKMPATAVNLEKDVLNFGAPPALLAAVGRAYPRKAMDAIRFVLCAHYGLRIPARPKKTRARRARAAA